LPTWMTNVCATHATTTTLCRVAKTFDSCMTSRLHATHCHSQPDPAIVSPTGRSPPKERLCIACNARPSLAPPRIPSHPDYPQIKPINARFVAN
jgi:hypothetical protein